MRSGKVIHSMRYEYDDFIKLRPKTPAMVGNLLQLGKEQKIPRYLEPVTLNTNLGLNPSLQIFYIHRPPTTSLNHNFEMDKPSGIPTPIASENATYSVSETPLGTTRHVRIVTVGAGASGINMIRTVRENLTDYEHVVYEKNPSIGGTWYENRYPGCMCDIPAHNYQFSWRHNPSWSTFFAGAQEIEKYLCTVCEEEEMGSSIKTSHEVKKAVWDDEKAVWELEVQNLETGERFSDYGHFLLDATGILK